MAIKGYDSAPSSVRAAITEAARLEGVDETALTRIIGRESTFNPQAANPKSSARGLGQFLDDTWNTVTAKHGSKYGITAATSRYDERASALMTAAHMKDNAQALAKSLGRAASSGEVYAAHFLGATGAAKMIQATDRNPGGNAAQLFPDAAKANPGVFYEKDGVTPRNMTAVLHDLTGGQGVSGSPVAPGALPNIYEEQPLPKKPGFFESLRHGYVMAAEQEQTQTMAAQYLMRAGDERLAPDDHFKWTPEITAKATEGLPEDYAKWVVQNGHSEAHAMDLRERAFHDMQNEAELAQTGMVGNLGLRGAAILTDIPTWLVGFGAGKLAGAARMGRLALAGRAGLIAAAEQVPMSAMKMAERPHYGVGDALVDTTTAFAFGSSFGAAFGKAGRELDDHFVGAAAKAQREEIEAHGLKLSPEGQEYFASMEAKAEPASVKPMFTSGGAAATPLPEASFLDKFTFDIASRLQKRANPEVREAGLKLDQYIQGDGGKTVRAGESAAEYARRVQEADGSQVKRVDTSAFEAWTKRKGVPLHKLPGAYDEFEEAIGLAIIGKVDNIEPEVAQAADAYRDAYKTRLQRAKAESALGAEDIPEDPNYFPVVYAPEKVRALTQKYGDAGVISVVKQAMRSAMPKLSEEVLDRIAPKWFQVVRNVTEGMQGQVSHAMSGLDDDALREFLQHVGAQEADIEAFMTAEKATRKTGPGNFRARTRMNYDSRFVPDTDGIGVRDATKVKGKTVVSAARQVGRDDAFSIRDLTDLNAARVWEKYNHSTAGHIAMSRAGFKSRSAYHAHVDDITLGRQDKAGYTPTEAKSDNLDLKYLGDRVYGVPATDNFLGENAQRVAAVFNDVNFSRNMGQAGVANLGDMPKVFQRTSMTAAVSEFRLSDITRVLQKGGQEADVVMRDLEAMTGVGTIRKRTDMVPLWKGVEEFYEESGSTKALDAVRRVTKTASNVVGLVGGMMPVNDFLGRWAVRAHLRHLVDITQGRIKVGENVLNDLGLGKVEIDRFKALTDHMSVNGRGSVTDMNLGKLRELDAEGVDLLAGYLSRQARTTVLEMTPGMLPRVMGTTMGRTLGQFRSFSMGSHVASTIHNLKMGPAYAANSFLVGGAWAFCIYTMHTYSKSIGRPDAEDYLAKALAPDKIIGGTINRHADAGMLPSYIDTAYSTLITPLTGQTSPFAYGRTSGLAAGINGIPAVDLLLSGEAAWREALKDGSGRGVMTQSDAQRLERLVPFNNLFLVSNAMKAMTGGLPENEPSQ